MSNLPSESKIPIGRIALWGLAGFGAFIWVAYSLRQPGIIWVGLNCIPIVMGALLGIVRAAETRWTKRNLALLLWIYILLQFGLLVRDFIARR